MPKLSDTMTEGVVAEWHKKVGDTVETGELLAEIETDKATMDFESFQEGVLLYIGVEKGATAPINSVLAIVGDKGEDYKSLLEADAKQENDLSEETSTEKEESTQLSSEKTSDSKSSSKLEELKAAASKVDAEVVKMPKLSDTMTDGVVAEWHKKIGESVESGELLAEIETDKATMEFESFQDGVLLYQGVKAGESAPVDTVLAILGEKGTDVQPLIDLAAYELAHANDAPEEEEQKAEPKVESITLESKSVASSVSSNNVPKKLTQQSKAPAPAISGKIVASPIARKLANERNLPLHLIPGSGDHGRIIKRDVDNFIPGGIANTEESYTETPVSQMRKIIAKRLGESKFSAPHFYLTLDIDMDNAMVARKAIIEEKGSKISFNDMVIKASAKALKKHPNVNSSWLGDKIRVNDHVHIGVAMAVEEGLLVPVVRFADQQSLQEISASVKEYAGKAKEKKLTPADWTGNTFTISNLGMFGIEEFTAIINPPDACILAVGGIKQVPVVKNGQVVPGNVMKVTLSCDHRVVDGAMGAAFLQTLKSILENPVLMFA